MDRRPHQQPPASRPARSRPRPSLSPALWRWIKAGLLLATLVYVGRELAQRLAALPADGFALDPGYVLAGGLAAALSSALFVPIYLAMQKALGSAAGPRAAAVVALVSPVGKYLPGKFGSLVGAIWVYRAFGVGPAAATGVTLLAAAASFAAVSAVLVPFLAGGGLAQVPTDLLRWLFLGVWAGGLVLAFPGVFVALVNRTLGWAGRPPLALRFAAGPYLRGVAWTAVQCLLMGSALWLVARATAPVAPADWYLFVASLQVAGTLGFFAVFAPAGIGVREGLLLAFLHGAVPDPALALAVLVLRINQVLVEVLLALVGLALWRRQGRAATLAPLDTDPREP